MGEYLERAYDGLIRGLLGAMRAVLVRSTPELSDGGHAMRFFEPTPFVVESILERRQRERARRHSAAE